MKNWTWPSAFAFAVLVAGIVYLHGPTDDPEIRKQLLGYLDKAVAFVIGAGLGGTVGFVRGRSS